MRAACFVAMFGAVVTMSASCGERSTPSTQDSNAASVDAVFADIRDDAPGCAVGVYRDRKLILSKGYGLANVEDGRRITPRTNFNLGSAAKPFTTFAALMLEDQGRLSLDDDVRRFVPELPDYGSPIRIRDLLQHTSGIRDWGSLEHLAGRTVNTMPEFLALLARQQRLNFTPGTQHEYSHSDFGVLSLVIERIVKEPFGAFLERAVLQPLGMSGSRVTDARGTPVPERAFGHERSKDGYRVLFSSSQTTGGENLYASVEDLRHWDRALEDGVNGSRPLVARMLTRPSLPDGETIEYAYGLRKGKHRGLAIVARGGHPPGMMVEFVHFPDQKFGVATLCNGDHLIAPRRGMQVAEVYLGTQMEPRRALPPVPPEASITAAELQKYAGSYRSPEFLDFSRFGIVDGKLAEFLIDTHQTMTYRGGGQFTGDGSPGDFRLQFTPSATGGPMRLEYLSEGESAGTAERIPEADLWRPSAAALAEYAGTYFSQELDTVWQLAAHEGDLVLRRAGTADALLVPIQPDIFSRGFGFWAEPLVARFEFKRDNNKRITHFAITTPPGEDVVRDLRFVKANADGKMTHDQRPR